LAQNNRHSCKLIQTAHRHVHRQQEKTVSG